MSGWTKPAQRMEGKRGAAEMMEQWYFSIMGNQSEKIFRMALAESQPGLPETGRDCDTDLPETLQYILNILFPTLYIFRHPFHRLRDPSCLIHVEKDFAESCRETENKPQTLQNKGDGANTVWGAPCITCVRSLLLPFPTSFLGCDQSLFFYTWALLRTRVPRSPVLCPHRPLATLRDVHQHSSNSHIAF